MAQTTTNKGPATAQYTVLRAICMAGERVEPGSSVELTHVQYTELKAAGKVGPLADKPAKATRAAKRTEPTEPAESTGSAEPQEVNE